MRVSSFLAIAFAFAATTSGQVAIDSNSFGGIRARAIGPAVMSGRIAAIDAVPADPASDRRMTLWVGAASGGVWKSVDAGISFKPVFDDHPQSIGALRVDPSAPDTVWVGTGESWTRNSVSVGRGVYKTTDGGDSWKLMGLEDSERIGAIRIDPTDGDTVFVCATGHLWDAGEERGVFKTADGGETWEKVLYVDADTGCGDVDLDPQDPSIVYAGMWQFRRRPDFFTSGGPGSGLYKSTDGGDTWRRLESGLPGGELGRISVAVSPSRPSVVYAVVEAEKTALYRSDDVGESWTEVNSSQNVQMRPFYFGELVVDPADFRRVYKPGFVLTVSTDGGKAFSSPFSGSFSSSVHPDHHALWIDPTNPQTVVLGTDGGVYVSHDRAAHWRMVEDLPVSQFYHA
ncbi:MAG: glycosyl hydrolase, partial [Thermoanaerobaculia bacterium]